ncbi:septum formation initiator family protein [Frankia sp. CNm7]|uniref:Septum formation initiator family protein n=1 Tax=Frankia nepalensis TaxID=1836974 RepID=A0A937RBQ9_9ACTN|nr:septum formation initiator family protein [Frankia nepalensis]MBL7498575.1 septum formation initiator family protein [Frankia nepalensis]MBL7515044.1 septum formation initiator family protein [Frankia nepalensis]MBL7518988.1 septum formation initiator family protein [Frankia nepalensis]MBL7629166.1 septum formation initiator family protein [Frankia nepalensis]
MARLPRRTTLTTRATLLAVVICVLVLTLAYPLRLYLRQQAEIAALRKQNAASQARVDALRAGVAKYDDDAWVEDEARRRLHYIRPGEKTYLMPVTPSATPPAPGGHGRSNPDDAWYSQLWSQTAP